MSSSTCAICLEALIPSNNEDILPIGAASCGHCMHCECFARWEQAKRRVSFITPCPVCKETVHKFTRLYISGDRTENEHLKKRLDVVMKKLVHERAKRKKTKELYDTLTGAIATMAMLDSPPFKLDALGEETQLCSKRKTARTTPSKKNRQPNRTTYHAAAASRRFQPQTSCWPYFGTEIWGSQSNDEISLPKDDDGKDDLKDDDLKFGNSKSKTRPDPPSHWAVGDSNGLSGGEDDGWLQCRKGQSVRAAHPPGYKNRSLTYDNPAVPNRVDP